LIRHIKVLRDMTHFSSAICASRSSLLLMVILFASCIHAAPSLRRLRHTPSLLLTSSSDFLKSSFHLKWRVLPEDAPLDSSDSLSKRKENAPTTLSDARFWSRWLRIHDDEGDSSFSYRSHGSTKATLNENNFNHDADGASSFPLYTGQGTLGGSSVKPTPNYNNAFLKAFYSDSAAHQKEATKDFLGPVISAFSDSTESIYTDQGESASNHTDVTQANTLNETVDENDTNSLNLLNNEPIANKKDGISETLPQGGSNNSSNIPSVVQSNTFASLSLLPPEDQEGVGGLLGLLLSQGNLVPATVSSEMNPASPAKNSNDHGGSISNTNTSAIATFYMESFKIKQKTNLLILILPRTRQSLLSLQVQSRWSTLLSM
jgi:hypothetical protein